MKVAIVSEFASNGDAGLENSYVRAFRARGHEVVAASLARKAHVLPRGLRQIEEVRDVHDGQPTLREQVMRAAPELVVLVKGRGVLAETVRAWRRTGLRVVNVFPDNPFEAAGVGVVGRMLLGQFRELDRMFVHDRFAVWQLKQMGIRADFIAFARDPSIHDLESAARSPFPSTPIVFVGNPDRERIRYLRAIADLGLSVYGSWARAPLAPDDPLRACVRGGAQLGRAMVQAVSSARLSINVLRHSQKTAHNMRTFETPACGVCCLSEASVGVQELMEPGREVALFRSPEDLRRTAVRLLASPAAIDDVARAGRARVEHETYAHRVDQVLASL